MSGDDATKVTPARLSRDACLLLGSWKKYLISSPVVCAGRS